MEIAPGVYSVKQLQGIFVHAFLIVEEDGLTLVDTLYASDAKPMLEAIENLGKMPQDIQRILLTHGHRAHLGGLAALKAVSGATVYAHRWEADIIEGHRKQQCMSFRPMKPRILWPFQIASLFGQHNPCQVDELIDDGDQVGALQVIHAPGHTPGHLAFFHAEQRVLFAGDVLLTWPELSPGWKGFNLNHHQVRRTLSRLAEVEPAVVGAGHGDPITEDASGQIQRLVERVEREGRLY